MGDDWQIINVWNKQHTMIWGFASLVGIKHENSEGSKVHCVLLSCIDSILAECLKGLMCV